MKDETMRRWRLVPLTASVLAAVAACGGGGGDRDTFQVVIPQLSAAVGTQFSGSCADLSARLSTLANTTITSVTTVAAGGLTVGGQPVREHCLVKGAMYQRVSPVDNASYAISFEMRLPKDW